MKIQSYSDIITNSSSELFVFDNKDSIDEVITALDDICPDWNAEYNEPIDLGNAENDDIDDYINFVSDYSEFLILANEKKIYVDKHPELKRCKPNLLRWQIYDYMFNIDIDDIKLFDKTDSYALKFAEYIGDTPEKVFSNWDIYNPFTNWKDNEHSAYLEISDYGYDLLRKKFKGTYTIRSKYENPDEESIWMIESIADRYHLG